MKTIIPPAAPQFLSTPLLIILSLSTAFHVSNLRAQGVMFAPDTISINDVFGLTLTPDGQTGFFVKSFGGREKLIILKSEMKNGHWQKPEIAPFSYSDSRFNDIDPVISPDGKLVLFNSNRPLPGETKLGDFNVWASKKTATGWGTPFVLSNVINSDSADIYAGMALSGNVYFGSRRAGGVGGMDLYVSKFENGQYQTPVNLGAEVNSPGTDSNPYIAPDESYLIYASGLPNAKSFMISFQIGGKWSSPMELPISTDPAGTLFCPMVHDGSKTFYFARTRVENGKRIENVYHIPLEGLKLESLRARAAVLTDYAGTYKVEPANGINTIKIWIKEGKLYGAADGQETLQLITTEVPDELQIVENGEKVHFTRKEKLVQSLKISMPEGTITANRQP